MKITIDCYDRKFTAELSDDVTHKEAISHCINLLCCVGYSKKTLDEIEDTICEGY